MMNPANKVEKLTPKYFLSMKRYLLELVLLQKRKLICIKLLKH